MLAHDLCVENVVVLWVIIRQLTMVRAIETGRKYLYIPVASLKCLDIGWWLS